MKTQCGPDDQFDPSMIATAKAMCRMGATDFEVYTELGISKSQFYRWRWKYSEFAAAMTLGKKAADDRVEAALYARAVGYDYESEKIVTVSQGDNQGSVVERVPIVEHVPPDIKAQQWWLQNRRPKQWQHRVTQQVEGSIKFETIQRDTLDLQT